MTIDTGGPLRGLVARWLMRFEAAGKILRMAFLGLTAASTGTSALIQAGYGHLALPALGAGAAAAALFAFVYVELGVFNRQNRERRDRGDNFAEPRFYMNHTVQGLAFARALEAVENGDDAEEEVLDAVKDRVRQYRDGIDMQTLETEGQN